MMKSIRFAIAFAAIALLPVVAAAQSAKTRDVELPISQIIALSNAIASLDAADRIIKDGASERVVKDHGAYKFAPGFMVAQSRNLSLLQPVVDGYLKELGAARTDIKNRCHCDIGTDANAAQELNDKNRDLLATGQKVSGMVTIDESELKLETNTMMPITTLSALGPIINFK